ncbi:MAG: hypothetical protein L0G99_07020 [Propionibacteriales bacterium]|nr:hypothetical protein [Propionibacteriales bacterium]
MLGARLVNDGDHTAQVRRLVVVATPPDVAAEVIASITEFCFEYLESAPVRVTGHDIPYPPAKLEKFHLPDLDRILDAVDRVLERPNSLSTASDVKGAER